MKEEKTKVGKMRVVRFCVTIMFIFFSGVGLASPLFATSHNKEYKFENLTINAEIKPDGSMLMEEQYTVLFKGEFNGLYRKINNTKGIKITDIVVEENSTAYQFNPGSTYGPPGTYYLKQQPEYVYVDWSFKATNERRTFKLKYTVLNAVDAYEDIAELNYRFIGDEWEQPFENVKVNLSLPPGAKLEEVRAWGHGPLYGNAKIIDACNIMWEISPLPEKTFLEGRVTFPLELIPGVKKLKGEKLPAILTEEEAWARESNLERVINRVSLILAVLLMLFSIFIALFTYLRYGREFKPKFQGDYYRKLPVSYSPALAGYLWRMKTDVSDFLATILDLGRRGLIKIEEYEKEGGTFFKSKGKGYYLIKNSNALTDTVQLESHEKQVLKFIFDEVGYGEKVSFDNLEEFAQRQPKLFNSFWRKWNTLITINADELNLFDKKAERVRSWQSMLGIMFTVVLALILKNQPLQLCVIILSGVILVFSALFIHRKSEHAVEDFAKLKAFRRFLLDFSNMPKNDLPSLVIWEYYLVYAVPLGVANTVIQQLNLVFPQLKEDDYKFGQDWYIGNNSDFFNINFNDFTMNINTIISSAKKAASSAKTATSSFSSGSGRGGGFSRGGGQGKGGGGGGVR